MVNIIYSVWLSGEIVGSNQHQVNADAWIHSVAQQRVVLLAQLQLMPDVGYIVDVEMVEVT